MARHKKFDETEALEAAMCTFWTKGFRYTSMPDLEDSMNLPRPSIYNAFGNKRELFDKAVTHYQNTVQAECLSMLENTPDIREGVKKLLRKVVERHFKKNTPSGCLVVLSIIEREQHATLSIAMLEEIFKKMQKYLHKRLKEARQKGELKKDSDPYALSVTIMTIFAGIIVMGKAGFSKSALNKVGDIISDLL